MIALGVCLGLGMNICAVCARNVDNLPEGTAYGKPIRPAAEPQKCMDWKPLPIRSIDATHGRQ